MDSSDYFKQGEKNKSSGNGKLFDNQTLNDSLSSLYSPPYSSSSQGMINRKKQGLGEQGLGQNHNSYLNDALSQPSDYSKKLKALQEKAQAPAEPVIIREEPRPHFREEIRPQFHYEPVETEAPLVEKTMKATSSDDVKNGYITILSLSLGLNLAVLALLQLFFATDGKLVLEWDAEYWYFYLIPAAAFLFLGYRKLGLFRE